MLKIMQETERQESLARVSKAFYELEESFLSLYIDTIVANIQSDIVYRIEEKEKEKQRILRKVKSGAK